jgi:hypothetical protein
MEHLKPGRILRAVEESNIPVQHTNAMEFHHGWITEILIDPGLAHIFDRNEPRGGVRINGHIPLENSNVELCSNHRHSQNTIDSNENHAIPFEFLFKLPALRYSRAILQAKPPP